MRGFIPGQPGSAGRCDLCRLICEVPVNTVACQRGKENKKKKVKSRYAKREQVRSIHCHYNSAQGNKKIAENNKIENFSITGCPQLKLFLWLKNI